MAECTRLDVGLNNLVIRARPGWVVQAPSAQPACIHGRQMKASSPASSRGKDPAPGKRAKKPKGKGSPATKK